MAYICCIEKKSSICILKQFKTPLNSHMQKYLVQTVWDVRNISMLWGMYLYTILSMCTCQRVTLSYILSVNSYVPLIVIQPHLSVVHFLLPLTIALQFPILLMSWHQAEQSLQQHIILWDQLHTLCHMWPCKWTHLSAYLAKINPFFTRRIC